MTTLLKYLLSAACIAYVLWGLDLSQLPGLLGHLSIAHVLIALSILLGSLIPAVLRLSLVADGVSLKVSFKALLIGAAINAAFPAKMGEVAKLLVLKREGPMTTGEATGAVFWERFSDLNCLLAIGLATAAAMEMPLALFPMASIVAFLWAGLAWLKFKPHHACAIIRRIPWQNLRNFLNNTVKALSDKKERRFYLKLTFLTAANWTIFIGFIFYFLNTIPGQDLKTAQIMTVVMATILGVAIPSAPAGVGVYESLVVGSLLLTGMAKEEALAIAITLHVLQALVPALLGFSVMAGTSYRPKDLRNTPSTH